MIGRAVWYMFYSNPECVSREYSWKDNLFAIIYRAIKSKSFGGA